MFPERFKQVEVLKSEAQQLAYQHPHHALQLAREAHGLLVPEDPVALRLQVLETLVNSLSIVGHHAEGLRHAWEMLTLAVETGDLQAQPTANQHIATLLSMTGQYEQSLPYFHAARVLSDQLSPVQYATSTLNLADALEKLGRLEDARQTYQSVLALSGEQAELEVIQVYAKLSLVGLQVLEFELGNLNLEGLLEGPLALEGVLQQARTERDRFLELYAHGLATRLLVHLGDLEAATHHFDAVWQLATELDQPRAWAAAHEAWAFLACLQENHSEAIQHFEKAAAFLEDIAISGELLQLLGSYVRYLKFWGEHQKAFEVLWKLYTLDQRVRTEGVILQAQLVSLQVQIGLARQENELHVQHVLELQRLQLQLQAQNQLLEKLSREDGLTGVYNRRHAVHLIRELGKQQGCVLLLFDVDHFKKVNDGFGHGAGDGVLTGITERVKTFLNPQDVFGRLGGEEFVVALPGASLQEGKLRAEAICQGISSHSWPALGGQQVTISIGVAEFCEGTLEAALHTADVALYTAKHQGRNQVVVAS